MNNELTPVVQELYKATKRLSEASREVFRLARSKSEAEHTYRKALAIQIVMLRADKVQATLIGDLARGHVADLKFERDLSSDTYRSAIAAMEALKVEINALQTVAKYSSEI